MKRRITKAELDEMERSAQSVTSLDSPFGVYDAIVWKDGDVFRVTTDSLNPVGEVQVNQISEEDATRLMALEPANRRW